MKDTSENTNGQKENGATHYFTLYLNKNGSYFSLIIKVVIRDRRQVEYPTFGIMFYRSDMNFDEYTKERLWPILVETVHALVMYPSHKAYIRDTILPEKPEIEPAELVARLKIPVGEASVILCELMAERKAQVNEAGEKL